MEKYQWDGNGVELGSLKNECEDELKKCFTKSILKKHQLQDKNDLTL